jgi:MoaA/NifB/PqqE/SkfB family radical SAM enzyme
LAGKRHLYIAMDLTDRCNLRCTMCVRTAHGPGGNPDLTAEQFRTIGEHCFHRAVALALSCVGEPLLSKDLCSILHIVRGYRIPFTEIVTNGMLLHRESITAMIDAGLSRLVVSIDGATASTYESIRIGADWSRLLTNLDLLQRIKSKRGMAHPVLRFNFVMMRSNIEELPALVKLAAQLGATQVTAQHMAVYEAELLEGESLFWHQELANRKLIEAHRLAAKLGVTFNAPPLFSSPGKTASDTAWLLRSQLIAGLGVLREFGPARVRVLAANQLRRRLVNRRNWCHHPWEIVFLDAGANVRPCINWGAEPPLGNCLDQSLDQIWNGLDYVELRDQLTGQRPLRQVCLHCPAVASGKVDDPTAFETADY